MFQGLHIFLSPNFTLNDITKAQKIIIGFKGKFSIEYEKEVNCMITNRVGSKNYEKALRYEIPIVKLQWLIDCYKNKLLIPFENYFLQPFDGLNISCTQLLPDEREKIQRLVETNGGIYSANLLKDACTHLIAKEPSGEKYIYAKNWKTVHIVNIDWIEQCTNQKRKIAQIFLIIILLILFSTIFINVNDCKIFYINLRMVTRTKFYDTINFKNKKN